MGSDKRGKSLQAFCAESDRGELLREWDAEKNGGKTPSDVSMGSHQKAWWRCSKGHSYCSEVKSRVQGTGCPVCAGRVVLPDENSLAARYPALVAEWDTEKNAPLLPTLVAPGTVRKVWWLCPKGHSYRAAISSRAGGGTGCPFCAGQKVIQGENDLAIANFFNRGSLTVRGGDFGTIRTENAGTTEIYSLSDGTVPTIAWLGTGATGGNTYTGSLTIKNGTIGGLLNLAAGTGSVEVKGGHFTYNESTQVMISIVDDANGTVTISDGTFDWQTANRFCMANTNKLILTGGTFKFNPSAEANKYVADGYIATENSEDGTWTVSLNNAGGAEGENQSPSAPENGSEGGSVQTPAEGNAEGGAEGNSENNTENGFESET